MHRWETPRWASLGSEFLTLNHQSTQVGDQLVGVKTSELEEKATAAHMISTYAAEIKGGGFFPYVEQVQAHNLIMHTETRSREGVGGGFGLLCRGWSTHNRHTNLTFLL